MSDNVARITPHNLHRAVPAMLARLPGWLVWRLEGHEGEAKPRKVPYYAAGSRRAGKQGSKEDRANLVTFAAACDAAARRGMTGVGLAILSEWGICAIDVDNCVGPNGELPPEIAKLATYTYAEYSPSGKGVRLFVVGNYGNRKKRATEDSYGFEVFSTNGFVTLTGNVLQICVMMDADKTVAMNADHLVRELCEKHFGTAEASHGAALPFDPNDPNSVGDPFIGKEPRLNLSIADMESYLGQLDPDMGREPWRNVGMALHHETEGDDTGFAIWDQWSSMSDEKYPGEEALRQQWESFGRRKGTKNITMRSVIAMVRDVSSNMDFPALQAAYDEAEAKAAAARALLPRMASPPDYEGEYRFESPADIEDEAEAEWWIKGVVPKANIGMLYGPSGSGKTFVTLEILLAISRGVQWQGKTTKQGRVLYIAAEGAGGVRNRLRAYCKLHGISMKDLTNISILRVAPNLLDSDKIGELLKSIAALGGADVIGIDTYARATPGANENASEDMSTALENCAIISRVTGALVFLVHHAGKDISKGARGWSGIKAGVDFELEIVRYETGERILTNSKQKEGVDNEQWGVVLKQVELGIDADGDVITSCVAVIGDAPDVKPVEKKQRDLIRLNPDERHVLEVTRLPEYVDKTTEVYTVFVRRCVELLPEPGTGRDGRQFRIQDAIKSLAKRAHPKLIVDNGLVIFIEETG